MKSGIASRWRAGKEIRCGRNAAIATDLDPEPQVRATHPDMEVLRINRIYRDLSKSSNTTVE
jgi:hypothetical protein